MHKIKSVVVFCGSKSGNNSNFLNETKVLGELLATNSINLIYGGGNVGIMGCIANAALEKKGNVVGVIPKVLVEWEQQHTGITTLHITENMHDRKALLYNLSDAAIILPGGYGTLDELFEIITWNNLKIHHKKVFILNTDGFYTHLINHIKQMQAEGFLYSNWEENITICNTPQEIMGFIL